MLSGAFHKDGQPCVPISRAWWYGAKNSLPQTAFTESSAPPLAFVHGKTVTVKIFMCPINQKIDCSAFIWYTYQCIPLIYISCYSTIYIICYSITDYIKYLIAYRELHTLGGVGFDMHIWFLIRQDLIKILV